MERATCLIADPLWTHMHPRMGTRTTASLLLCSPKSTVSPSKPGLSTPLERRLPLVGCPSEKFSRLQETQPKVGKEWLFLPPNQTEECQVSTGLWVLAVEQSGKRCGVRESWVQGQLLLSCCAEVSSLTSPSLTLIIHNHRAAGRVKELVCKAYSCYRSPASFSLEESGMQN